MQQDEKSKNIEPSNVTELKTSEASQNEEKKGKWQDKLPFKNLKPREKIKDIHIKPEFIEAGKKTANVVKEKVIDARKTISESLSDETNERTYSIFAYFPILGPIVVFLFKRKQKLSRIHATNAAYLQIGFLAVWLAIWLLENIPVVSDILEFIRAVPYITNALMYLNIIMLIVFSIYGIFEANKSIEWRVPYLVDFVNKRVLKKKPVVTVK